MNIDKDKIETMCRAAGLKPVERRTFDQIDVVVADGYVSQPHITFQKFNVEKNDFPLGCYGTFWWALRADERMLVAYPMFFDALHDMNIPRPDRQAARVETAFQNAEAFITEHRDTLIDAIPTHH